MKKKTWLLSAGSLTAVVLSGYHFYQNHKHEGHQLNYHQKQRMMGADGYVLIKYVDLQGNLLKTELITGRSGNYITVTAPNKIGHFKLADNRHKSNFLVKFNRKFVNQLVFQYKPISEEVIELGE